MMNSMFTSCIIAGVLVLASVVKAQSAKGTPGVDYPNYHSIPATSFKCSEQKYIPGFYADLETNCQAFHFCFKNNKESFLCPTGTIFNQEKLACDSWLSSNCSLTPLFYHVNDGPAMKNAGKKLPMLLKLRNRSQDKTGVTTSVYETLSSLYGGSTDRTPLSENAETSNFSLNTNEESIKNETDKSINEESSAVMEAELESEQLSEDSGLPLEEILQSDSSEDSFEENLIYDPVTDGYYVDYDPYEAELQQDPENEEFRNFYESMGYDYGAALNDYNDYWSEDKAVAQPSHNLDLNSVGEVMDESEFSKRRLAEHQFIPYRRRPTYVVLEDDNSEFPGSLDGSVLENESDLKSSEYVTVETSDEMSEFPLGDEGTKGVEAMEKLDDQEFIDELKDLQFPYRPEYSTEIPLTSEAFSEAINEMDYPEDYKFRENEGETLQTENEQMDGESVEDMQDQPVYVLDGEESDRYLNTDKDLYETEESGAVDDTYIVIPDESDVDSPSLTDDAEMDGTKYKNPLNEYTFDEMDPNEQMDAPKLEDRDEYEYYKLYQNRPESVDSTSQENPFSESFYYKPVFDTEEAYTRYTPSFARKSFLYFLQRNQRSAYQGDQPMDVVDPVYGAGNGYVSGNYYDPYTGQISDYYESEEASQYYPRTDASCSQDSVEDAELQNQFGVSDEPFMNDLTESEFQSTEESMVTTESSNIVDADFNEFVNEQPEETYYVFDFDEDEQVDESNMKDPGNETSDFNARSDELEAGQIFKKQTFDSGESSTYTDNISLDEASASSNVNDFQGNELRYMDSLQTSQSSGEKLPDSNSKPTADSWSQFVPENSVIDEKPIAISSALERLASRNTKATQPPGFNKPEFSGDTRFMNNMPFHESMDFGAYGYGSNMGQQFGVLDSMQVGTPMDTFSHRTGENERPSLSKFSSIQERLRSMKQGKFGVFKKYMNTMKNQDAQM